MASQRPLGQLLGIQMMFIAVIPLLMVAVLLWQLAIPRIHEAISVRHQVLASSISGRITTLQAGAEHELKSLGTYIESRGVQSREYWCNLLDSHVGEGEIFEAIYLSDEGERVEAVGLPVSQNYKREDMLGLDLSLRPFFRRVKTGYASTWSETFLSTISGRLAIALLIPVEDRVLIGEITIEHLSEFISFKFGGSALLIMIVDGDGRVIADSQNVYSGQSLDTSQIAVLRQQSPGEAVSATAQVFFADHEYISTAVTVGKLGWRVLVAQPAREAFQHLTETFWFVAAAVVIALVLAVIASLSNSASWSRSFRRYITQVQEIAGGNYDRPWPGSTIAEFSELEGHLQTMAAAIQAREKALSASEAKYRSVVSNAPVIIVQIDPDGMIGLIEGKGLAAMGMKPGEGEGKSWFDLFRHDKDLCDRVRKAIAGEEQQFTSEHERGVFDIHLAPVPDGGDSCSVLCIAVDITRRVMAEKALQEYACLLEESQKVARLGFYIFHPPAMTWQASEVLDEILGIDGTYSRSQEGFLELVHPEDRPMISAYLSRSMQKLHVPFDQDFRIVRADNRKERWVHGSTSGAKPPWEGQDSIIGVIQDITEKRQLEARLRKAQQMESLGLLAGGVAHDLNNILSGIINYPELILIDLPKGSHLRAPLLAIRSAGQRAAAVVDDLLSLARGVSTVLENYNLNRIIGEYFESPEFELLRSLHGEVAFRTALDPDLLNINCSVIHIRKCVMNLVTNAVEAIKGKGEVVITTRNQYCDEPLPDFPEMQKGEYSVLSVADTGIGISAESLGRIFEPFFSQKMSGRSGTGLGLAMAWSTMRNHNGGITVESSGEGTVFDLYFPANREALESVVETVDLQQYLGNGERILVVDDDEIQQIIVRKMLERLGYVAHIAGSGEDGLRFLQTAEVDLVILDMLMGPGMNGYETYLKILEIHPGQKAIIASGYSQSADVREAMECGVKKFVRKPYSIRKLAVVIRETLRQE